MRGLCWLLQFQGSCTQEKRLPNIFCQWTKERGPSEDFIYAADTIVMITDTYRPFYGALLIEAEALMICMGPLPLFLLFVFLNL